MTRKEFAQKLLLQSMVMRGTDFNKTESPTEADGRAMVNRSRYITELVAEIPNVFFSEVPQRQRARRESINPNVVGLSALAANALTAANSIESNDIVNPTPGGLYEAAMTAQDKT